jgi:hypothetical protein
MSTPTPTQQIPPALANWKTTVAGVGLALAGVLTTALQAVVDGQQLNWASLLSSLAVGVIGYFASDAKQSSVPK